MLRFHRMDSFLISSAGVGMGVVATLTAKNTSALLWNCACCGCHGTYFFIHIIWTFLSCWPWTLIFYLYGFDARVLTAVLDGDGAYSVLPI